MRRREAAALIMTTIFRQLLLLLAVAALSGCAAIFNTASCSSPVKRNPPQAFVSMFVVPLEGDSSSPVVEKAATESARLIKVESIKANADGNYSSITLLSRLPLEQKCDAGRVMETIYEAQHERQTLLNDSVVVWGIVVKRDDQLYSQMYSRILWQDEEKRLYKLNFESSSTRKIEFQAKFPELTVAFPQKFIGTGLNDEFVVDRESLGIVRAGPSSSAIAVDLPAVFTIGPRENGWIPLNTNGGRAAWLNAAPVRATNGERLFPETEYFFAVSAFVKGRVLGLDEPATRNKLGKLLNDYVKQYGEASDPEARTLLAIVNLMLAFQEFPRAPNADDEISARARNYVQAAARLLPGNPEIANLAALASLGDCCSGRDAAAHAAVVQGYFDRALKGDRANILLLHNLDKWYSLLEQRGITPQGMTNDEVLARHADVRDRLHVGR